MVTNSMELSELSYSPGHTDDFYNNSVTMEVYMARKNTNMKFMELWKKVSSSPSGRIFFVRFCTFGQNEKLSFNSICERIFGTFAVALRYFLARNSAESETFATESSTHVDNIIKRRKY